MTEARRTRGMLKIDCCERLGALGGSLAGIVAALWLCGYHVVTKMGCQPGSVINQLLLV